MAVTNVAASLIIRGITSNRSAAEVTAALGIQPTRSFEYGDPHPSASLAARGKVVLDPLWVYDEPRSIQSTEDPHGIESLVRLAERFEPLADALAILRAGYDIQVSMFGTSDSGQAGLYIGPETMRRLGRLSASFVQDFWIEEQATVDDAAGIR